jgi:outer membrane protein TolC
MLSHEIKKIRWVLAQIVALFSLTVAAVTPMKINADTFDTREIPPEFLSLGSEMTEVIAFVAATDTARAEVREAEAQLQGSKQKWMPSVAFEAAANRQKSESRVDNQSTMGSGPANSFQWGLTLRQNIYSGGSDVSQLQSQQKQLALATLEAKLFERETIRSWMMDLIQIQRLSVLQKFNQQTLEQASQLHQQTQRKVASGFLGKRDLLNSERELLRIQNEVISNSLELKTRIKQHIETYGTKAPDAVAQQIIKILESEQRLKQAISKDDSEEALLQGSLFWRRMSLQSEISEKELNLSENLRFAPRIDAVAGWNESELENASSPSSPNSLRRRNWSLSINGSVSIQPPVSFAAVDTARARYLKSKTLQQKLTKEQLTLIASAFERLSGNEKELQIREQLTAATRRLHEQNQRLFDAGEISLDRLIATQQDLDRDQKNLASLSNQSQQLRLSLFFAKFWQLLPAPVLGAEQQ